MFLGELQSTGKEKTTGTGQVSETTLQYVYDRGKETSDSVFLLFLQQIPGKLKNITHLRKILDLLNNY